MCKFVISEDTTIEDIYHLQDALNFVVGNVQEYKRKEEQPPKEWIVTLQKFMIEAKSILTDLEKELNTL